MKLISPEQIKEISGAAVGTYVLDGVEYDVICPGFNQEDTIDDYLDFVNLNQGLYDPFLFSCCVRDEGPENYDGGFPPPTLPPYLS